MTLVSDNGRRIEDLHEVVALTGPRPDHSWTAELRLDLDERLEAPVRLAPSPTPTSTPAAPSTHTAPPNSPTPTPTFTSSE
nr:hypothetical protein [Parafrankia sp. BMG5.11]